MKVLNIIYAMLLGCLLVSCAEDLGNYSYHELIEPEISGVEADLSALTFSRLQLTPDLGENEFSESAYSFEWKAISMDAGTVSVIGQERNLDYEVQLPEGSYKLFFTVTEKASGVYWQQSYNLQVNQATSEGWMVLCSVNGKTRLDMKSEVTGEIYFDLLKNSGLPEWNGPRKIQQLNAEVSETDSPFYLLTDEGATRLGKNGFEWKEEYSLRYEMANGQDPFPHEILEMGVGKVMVSGTDFYFADCMGIAGLYGSPVNKNFRVAPQIGTNVATTMIMVPVALMYDTDNKRFVGYSPNLASEDLGNFSSLHELNELGRLADEFYLTGKNKAGVIGTAFDEFPEGLDFVYMENTRYDPGNGKMGVTYTVLADGDKRYLYGIQLGDMLTFADCSAALGKAYYGDISNCTRIAQVTDLFAFSSLKNYMYYAVGNSVYRVDLSVLPLKAERQFSLNGETITCLKFNLYQNSQNAAKSYDLVVGSEKNGEGILRIYEGLESEGDFKKVKPVVYSGFGHIVDATYRENE